MARKIRIEYAGARYHVLDRGNYREPIFRSEGSKKSFLNCLCEVSLAQNWLVHAWCLMENHYHLCLQTLDPNLVDGMSWLQSTFANRFNRFRKTSGHVFQGRYKAIVLDSGAVGPVCHYIHLNPVRAGIIDISQLEKYKDSSFRQLWYPRRRWKFARLGECLDSAGGLADSPSGRRLYRDYLAWLAQNEPEQKRLGFDEVSKGWAKGDASFKKSLLEEFEIESAKKIVEGEAREVKELLWERRLEQGLGCLEKSASDLEGDRKGAPWKVALARYMRESLLVPNTWLCERMHMGTPTSLSSLISRHRKTKPRGDRWLGKLKNQEYVD